MATVKLKLITVSGEEAQLDAALSRCLDADFHIEDAREMMRGQTPVAARSEINPHTPALAQLDALAAGLRTGAEGAAAGNSMVQSEPVGEGGTYRGDDLTDLFASLYMQVRFGHISGQHAGRLPDVFSAYPDAAYFSASDGDRTALAYFVPSADCTALDGALDALGFVRTIVPAGNAQNRFEKQFLSAENDGRARLEKLRAYVAARRQEDKPEIESIQADLTAWKNEYAYLCAEHDRVQAALREDEVIEEQLSHLADADIRLDDLFSLEYFRFRFGKMPRESYDNMMINQKELDDVFFFVTSLEKEEVWGFYFAPHICCTRVDAVFSSMMFERVTLSERAHGTPGEAIAEMKTDISSLQTELDHIQRCIHDFSTAVSPMLSAYRDALTDASTNFELRKNIVVVKNSFCLVGWVPAKQSAALSASLEALPGVTCTLDRPRPTEKLRPPTKLKNFILFRPFEEFVRMYGLPSYNEMDPTPLVALTYILFFGLMFGDVGQGVLLIIAGLVMHFAMKMKLGPIISLVGISATGFGFFYGSVFGFEDIIHGFNPMENMSTVLFAAVGIGMVMICLCIVLNIINGIRQKDLRKIVFSPNGLVGLLLYVAAVIVALGMFGMIGNGLPTGVLIAVVALMLFILFLAEPLLGLVRRRRDWMPKNKGEFFLESFFELFEVVLSYLTNTISFIRVGAFALSHVGMMSVVFLLAGAVDGNAGNPVELILGNLFVTGFEGLIVGIQVLRLEFYELFGRFYEGGGKPFVRVGKDAE